MAITLRYSAGDETSVFFKLNTAERSQLRQLEQAAPADYDVVFGIKEIGEPEPVQSLSLAMASEKLSSLLKGLSPGLRAYNIRSSTGTTNRGIMTTIGGVPHYISVGIGRCTIKSMQKDSSGNVVHGDEVDIRDRQEIHTDHATLRINSQEIGSSKLSLALREILDFASKNPSSVLSKTVI